MKDILLRILRALRAPFDRYVERRDQREALMREHQLALVREIVKGVEALTDGQVAQAREQSVALIEIAKANAAQAEAFSKWLQSFSVSSSPTSSTVTEEQEWEQEQRKLAEAYGLPAEIGPDLPEEFRLAHELKTSFAAALAADKL